MPDVSAGFQNAGHEVFSAIIGLLGVTVVSFVYARRTAAEDLLSRAGWKRLTWSRMCVMLIFTVSWAFIFSASVLISGAGLSLNVTTCSMGIYCCILLYSCSKILIYGFLVEKVWIVWEPRLPGHSAHKKASRWSSPTYRMCLLGLSPFCIVVSLLFVSRISEIRSDGACVIGLKNFGSLTLLVFDLFVTLSLTCLFVYPLTRGDVLSPRLRRIATRTLAASLVALLTSAANITILASMHGRQLGWVCLSSCGTDVTINAMVIFWVTGGTSSAARVVPPPPMSPRSPQDSKFNRNIDGLKPHEVPSVTYSQIARKWHLSTDSIGAGDIANRANRRLSREGFVNLHESPSTARIRSMAPTYVVEPRTPPSVLSRGVYAIHYSHESTLNIAPPPTPRFLPSNSLPQGSHTPTKENPNWIARLLSFRSRSLPNIATTYPPSVVGPSSVMGPPSSQSEPSIDDRVWAKPVMASRSSSRGSRSSNVQAAAGTMGRKAPSKPPLSGRSWSNDRLQVTTQTTTLSELSTIEFRPFETITELDDVSLDYDIYPPAFQGQLSFNALGPIADHYVDDRDEDSTDSSQRGHSQDGS